MLSATDAPRRWLAAFKAAGLTMFLLVMCLIGSIYALPATGSAAQDSSETEPLRQEAQSAFLKGNYAAAAAFDLEMAEKHPGSPARRYAVQMLGTIYEDNLVDLTKAIKWDREFLDHYAESRQVPFYQDKLATLEKLATQEGAFKTYQSIRFANQGDAVMVKQFEALLKEHPDFLLRDKVESELGYAYSRMDQRVKSARAFAAEASQGRGKLSGADSEAYQTESRYSRMQTAWAWAAWVVIAALWALVLWMKPWQQMTSASIRKFILWPVLWLALTGASMPIFYSMETTGYPIVIPGITVFIAIGLNLIVLAWLLLLIHGKSWRSRPRARRWLMPLLALLMTAGVFYLWVVYQPNGPYIVDECAVKLKKEWREHVPQKQSAEEQGKSSAQLPATTLDN